MKMSLVAVAVPVVLSLLAANDHQWLHFTATHKAMQQIPDQCFVLAKRS